MSRDPHALGRLGLRILAAGWVLHAVTMLGQTVVFRLLMDRGTREMFEAVVLVSRVSFGAQHLAFALGAAFLVRAPGRPVGLAVGAAASAILLGAAQTATAFVHLSPGVSVAALRLPWLAFVILSLVACVVIARAERRSVALAVTGVAVLASASILSTILFSQGTHPVGEAPLELLLDGLPVIGAVLYAVALFVLAARPYEPAWGAAYAQPPPPPWGR